MRNDLKLVLSAMRGVLLFALAVTSLSADWETLDGCRLVSSSKNDGDSFVVKNGSETYTFRLYFVDTPETGLFYPDRVADQANYFGADVDEMLRIGEKSDEFARRFLSGRFTVHTEWKDAMGHNKRYAALLYNHRGESLIEALIEAGYARIKGFTPDSAWPGGQTSRKYRSLLEKLERTAQRKNTGAWRRSNRNRDTELGPSPVPVPGVLAPTLVDLNTALVEELIALPGIGPVYANRIIQRRPFLSKHELLEVSGIGPVTLQKLESLVAVTLPERFKHTARFYLQQPEQWANQEVQLRIASLTPLDIETPEGFHAFTADTGSSETNGGPIRLFLPQTRTGAALDYFKRTSEPAKLFVFFFNYKDEWVAVLRAN